MELSTTDGQLCMSIDTHAVRLPQITVADFDLPPLVLGRFCSDPDSILDPSSTGGPIWCHVLPSMKKGQIITISRQLPKDAPFRTYRDLQNHWNSLYGYRLPELSETEVVYCSVYFRLVGERLFTYPLSCIRLKPIQRCPRVDLQGALGSFLSDIRDKVQSVCGFPARLTRKPCYHTTSLTSASLQVLSGDQVNVTTSSSVRPVLTQLPPPPPPPPPQPVSSSFGSQPPPWIPLSLQDGAQGLLGNGYGSRSSQGQGCRGVRDWTSSSSSSSSSVSLSVSDSAPLLPSFSSSSSLPLFQSASSFTFTSTSSSTSSSSSSSSSSLPLFQPASSLTSTSSSSSVPFRLPPPVNRPPKLGLIFKHKQPCHHVNVALLRAQKQTEGGGAEERGRLTLPAFRKNTPATAPPPPPPPSSSSSSIVVVPSRFIPSFKRHRNPPGIVCPLPSALPKIKYMRSLSAESQSTPRLALAPNTERKHKCISTPKVQVVTSSENSIAAHKQEEATQQTSAAAAEDPRALTSDISHKEKDTFCSSEKRVRLESKLKKSRAATPEVDVEEMARRNQLSKVNSARLLSWLSGRGVLVSGRHKKEELMLKVMGCLAEA